MTRDEILKMEAGKELDVLILQTFWKVKKIYWVDAGGELAGINQKTDSPYYIPSGKPWRTHRIDSRYVPYFSTDISAAWQVVEKMNEKIENRPNPEDPQIGYYFLKIMDAQGLCACPAKQAALIICRAALLVVS